MLCAQPDTLGALGGATPTAVAGRYLMNAVSPSLLAKFLESSVKMAAYELHSMAESTSVDNHIADLIKDAQVRKTPCRPRRWANSNPV